MQSRVFRKSLVRGRYCWRSDGLFFCPWNLTSYGLTAVYAIFISAMCTSINSRRTFRRKRFIKLHVNRAFLILHTSNIPECMSIIFSSSVMRLKSSCLHTHLLYGQTRHLYPGLQSDLSFTLYFTAAPPPVRTLCRTTPSFPSPSAYQPHPKPCRHQKPNHCQHVKWRWIIF